MNDLQKKEFLNGYYDFYREMPNKTKLNVLLDRIKFYKKYGKYMQSTRKR